MENTPFLLSWMEKGWISGFHSTVSRATIHFLHQYLLIAEYVPVSVVDTGTELLN